MGEAGECAYPHRSKGSATTNPAMGPATPMSSTARRDGMSERMRMTAPRVPTPMGNGKNGMKKGSVASTRWRRAST